MRFFEAVAQHVLADVERVFYGLVPGTDTHFGKEYPNNKQLQVKISRAGTFPFSSHDIAQVLKKHGDFNNTRWYEGEGADHSPRPYPYPCLRCPLISEEWSQQKPGLTADILFVISKKVDISRIFVYTDGATGCYGFSVYVALSNGNRMYNIELLY